MKVEMREHEGCYEFELRPETMEDCNRLTRMAINHTKEIRSAGAMAHRDGTWYGFVVIGKRKNDTSEIKP